MYRKLKEEEDEYDDVITNEDHHYNFEEGEGVYQNEDIETVEQKSPPLDSMETVWLAQLLHNSDGLLFHSCIFDPCSVVDLYVIEYILS